MRVEQLQIDRGSYYSENKALRGTITLIDASGAKLEVPLTPGAISKLITCISKEVVSTLNHVASNAPKALQDAQDEALLLENDGVVSNQ